MNTEDIVLEVAMKAARIREARDGTPWRESLAETWLEAREGKAPRRADSYERRINHLSTMPIGEDVEEIDAVVAQEVQPIVEIDAQLRRNEIAEAVARELLRLPARMERILRLRFGFFDDTQWRRDEVAATMNVTDSLIYIMEHKAMRRLSTGATRLRLMPVVPEAIQASIRAKLAEERAEHFRHLKAVNSTPDAPSPPRLRPAPPHVQYLPAAMRDDIARRFHYDLSRAA